MKTALITGVTGQDGSYLAELLLKKEYKVYGLVRRSSTGNTERLEKLKKHENYVEIDGDLLDQNSLSRAIKESEPDEIYNLAAQSFVGSSWDQAEVTCDISSMGALRMLEAARMHAPDARFYQASSSEMFGNAQESPQNEETPFHPRSPYGVAKLSAHEMSRVYRESHNMHVSCGILFNHESPRRGEEFVTRKITLALANIIRGRQNKLILGNLDARRDWGYAGDYVKAMHIMVQEDEPGDYVIATGKTHSIKEFLEIAFSKFDLNWEDYVIINEKFFRPAEVHELLGDATKAHEAFLWKPETSFKELVEMMAVEDYMRLGSLSVTI